MHSYEIVRRIRNPVVLASTALMLTVASCGGPTTARPTHTPSPSATPTESPVQPLRPLVLIDPSQPITEAEVRAVVDGVFVQGIFLDDPMLYAECQYYHGGEPTFKACPLTPRLEARLTSHIGRFPPRYGAGAFCRCLAVSGDIEVATTIRDDAATAHVRLFGGAETVDLVLTLSQGYLLVDDIQCNGRGAASSIYVDPIPSC